MERYRYTSRNPRIDQRITVGVHAANSQKITSFNRPCFESKSNFSRIPKTLNAVMKRIPTRMVKIIDCARNADRSLKPMLLNIEAGKKNTFKRIMGV
jgi:hypothetical protein